MADSVMQVDAQQMINLAGDIRKCQSQMKTNIDNGKAQIDSLKGVWTGDGADSFHASFSPLYQKSCETLQFIEKMASALNEAAETYAASEKKIESEASSMKKLTPASFN